MAPLAVVLWRGGSLPASSEGNVEGIVRGAQTRRIGGEGGPCEGGGEGGKEGGIEGGLVKANRR